ncbi:hypothetical protein PoB_006362100 [Plakobranchus ocellatus]|uniref:Uncharacterized protein n=1 Tax=Plakobranchus ocellatus TaxID=259542 RepID=A0AAV4CZ71_9GAST|nr:hypothetical protein PoB_006362100 [Plakobranchus ocellatus]
MFGCEVRRELTTSNLPVEVIARKGTEEDLLAVTPIKPDSDIDKSPSKTDGAANRIQATSDETPAHDVTDRVLLPVEHGNTSAQVTNDNVTSQPKTTEILDIPTGPSLSTATLSALDVEILFLLENQKSIWHLSHPLHLTVLFPLLKTTELHNTSKKSKGVVMK